MAAKDKILNETWKIVLDNIPIPVILWDVIYLGIVCVGSKVYNTLTTNERLTEEYIQSWTSKFIWAFIIITIMVILINLYSIIKVGRKLFKKRKLPKGKIDAFIVEQDEPSRDNMFIDINQNVKKTYWVLGVSLTSIVEHEKMLEKMATEKIDIRLCMLNPDIAVNNLCLNNVKNNACVLENLLKEIAEGTVKMDNIQEKVKCVDNYDNLLEIYHVLINVIHFNEYYATATDYKERIKNSYDSLKLIRNNIVEQYGQGFFDLKVADSFIPMSLTIADANEETGRMIVEFHLPFTQYKVLFEINRNDNEDLFKVFVNFYNTVWNRAQGNE